jgi:hypothetical protein
MGGGSEGGVTLEDRANLAGQAATQAGFYAHGAALAPDREEKRQLLARAFQAWSLAARQWSELEALAPNCAREGYDEAARLRDVVEGRAA